MHICKIFHSLTVSNSSGSIVDAWFDSNMAMESDCDDDFHSVQDGIKKPQKRRNSPFPTLATQLPCRQLCRPTSAVRRHTAAITSPPPPEADQLLDWSPPPPEPDPPPLQNRIMSSTSSQQSTSSKWARFFDRRLYAAMWNRPPPYEIRKLGFCGEFSVQIAGLSYRSPRHPLSSFGMLSR
ncbi:uncharacterized protein A4U43_C08F30380 [Asparagus officinalis]|nr:uncharacterized protein A4U43_C08F30380 [Asparagus officinalis]